MTMWQPIQYLRQSGIARAALCLALCVALAGPAHADLQVNLRRDKVELTDGTVIECIVLMQTERVVLVAIKNPDKEDGMLQKIIPIAQVKKITKGPDEGQVKGLKTDTELARKVIQGSGFRKDDKDSENTGPAMPTGPVQAVQPLVPAPRPVDNTPKPVANSKRSPTEVANEYMARFPDLRAAAQVFLGGADKLPEYFQRAQKDDVLLREQLGGTLNLFLQSIQPPEQASGKQQTKQPAQPKPPTAKPPPPKPVPPADK